MLVYSANHITAENGVDEGIYVTLGGQEQYLLIRGKDVTNPVAIWLHGGPGGPDACVNYTFQKYLVDDYTVVNWDRRACGRTYYQNKDTFPDNKTVFFEQTQQDLDELVHYLCQRFHQKQVIIIGHSFGTLVGSGYVITHPKKVSAYIAVSQFVSKNAERYSYEDAIQSATEKGKDTAKLEKAYQEFVAEDHFTNWMKLRMATAPYHNHGKNGNIYALAFTSPYMGLRDLKWNLKLIVNRDAMVEFFRPLFEYMISVDVSDYGLVYQVPVGFICGENDWTTPWQVTQEYFEKMTAPRKMLEIIEECGHSPQYGKPAEFADLLKKMLEEIREKKPET